jgi:hypothetical protein
VCCACVPVVCVRVCVCLLCLPIKRFCLRGKNTILMICDIPDRNRKVSTDSQTTSLNQNCRDAVNLPQIPYAFAPVFLPFTSVYKRILSTSPRNPWRLLTCRTATAAFDTLGPITPCRTFHLPLPLHWTSSVVASLSLHIHTHTHLQTLRHFCANFCIASVLCTWSVFTQKQQLSEDEHNTTSFADFMVLPSYLWS